MHTVRSARLTLPLSVTVGFLTQELAAPVPPHVLTALDAAGTGEDRLAHEVAQLLALTSAHDRLRTAIASTPGLVPRLALLRALIAPSPAAVRATSEISSPLPLYYAMRTARYVLRNLRQTMARRLLVVNGPRGRAP
jgi:hypothetical protein